MAEWTHIAGGAQLRRAFRELAPRVAAHGLTKAASDGAAVVRDYARIKAPVWQGVQRVGHPPAGTLRGAINIKHVPSARNRAIFVVFVRHGPKFQKVGKKGTNKNAYYWWWVEFGTAKMTAEPFLRPAFLEHHIMVRDLMIEDLKNAVETNAAALSWGRPS